MDTPTVSPIRTRSFDLLLWLSWVAANTAAILFGFAILYGLIFLAKAISPGINEDRVFGAVMFPILGVVLGSFQWFVLRRRIPRAGWWILATTLGMFAGVTLGMWLINAARQATGQSWSLGLQASMLMLVGLSLALAQLLVLRPNLTLSVFWLLINVTGWIALTFVIGVSIDRMSDVLAFGSIPAMFSGFGLIMLLPQRH